MSNFDFKVVIKKKNCVATYLPNFLKPPDAKRQAQCAPPYLIVALHDAACCFFAHCRPPDP